MKLKSKSYLNNNGLSLLETMVALGISSIIMVGIVSMIDLVNKNNMRQNFNQARGEIINRIRVQSLSFDNLKASAQLTKNLGVVGLTPNVGSPNSIDHYDMLAKCMPEVVEANAVGCDKNVMDSTNKGNQFYLADNNSTDPSKSIAGTDVYYRGNGIRCTQTEAQDANACPIKAEVWFEPYCLNFSNTCNKAMSLAVRYAVGLRSDSTVQNIGLLEGEIYIPLQKGIQLSRLLNQEDFPISSNSHGIFTVEKYYGYAGQFNSGLRFEAIISNPTGLSSMKLQQRSITGTAAKDYDDSQVPTALESASWQDVITPNNAGLGAWTINLTNARPNQIFNFGTQINIGVGSRNPGAAFIIGSGDSTNATYRWTQDTISGIFKPPTFKSGIYQFRILAQDAMGGTMESTNYFTVRIIGRPEFKFLNTATIQTRNCVDSNVEYKILVGDDEYITESNIKINTTDQNVAQINGDRGSYTIPFNKSQDAGAYSIVLSLKNRFSDVNLETTLIPKVLYTHTINLNEASTAFNSITSVPNKIRLNSNGVINTTYTTGNCCTRTPSISWNYLSQVAFGNTAILSSPTTNTPMSCSVSGGSRTCTASTTVTGIKEGPTSTTSHDISATIDLGATPPSACQVAGTAQTTAISTYIPVVKNPNIGFYQAESLWLDIPAGSIKSINNLRRVVVRADFPPSETVKVQVVQGDDPDNVICNDITFTGNTTTNVVDVDCQIPNNFTGRLLLQKHPDYVDKIQDVSEATTSTQRAKLAGNVEHVFCNTALTNLSDQSLKYRIPSTLPMNDSPWGYTTDSNGNIIQDTKNDTGLWNAGVDKNLRCYDSWTSYNDLDNKQDFYDLAKYNDNQSTVVNYPGPQYKHKNMGSAIYPVNFASFIFPANPPMIVDTTAKSIPYLYAVYQTHGAMNPTPATMVWQFKDTSGAVAQTTPQNWEDVTSQVCTGNSSLSKVKLYRTAMSVQSSSSNIIMKATNGFFANTTNGGIYSYYFMCSYGRWHPSGKSSVTWTN